MRLKSFYAPTMADAMDLVRSILGDDAIIVATRQEADGVRVTAAVEEGRPGQAPPKAPPQQDRDEQAETLAMLSEAVASVRDTAPPPAAWCSLPRVASAEPRRASPRSPSTRISSSSSSTVRMPSTS